MQEPAGAHGRDPSVTEEEVSPRAQYWWRISLYETEDGGIKHSAFPFRRIEFRVPASWQSRPDRDLIDAQLEKVGYRVSRKLDRRAKLKEHGGEWDWRAGASVYMQQPGVTKSGRIGDMERPFVMGPGPDEPVKSVGRVRVIDWPNGRPRDRGNLKARLLR